MQPACRAVLLLPELDPAATGRCPTRAPSRALSRGGGRARYERSPQRRLAVRADERV
jgi:hypothetical protein